MTQEPMPPGLHDAILARDQGRCLRCTAAPEPGHPLEIDHLIPRGMGGSLPADLRWDPMELATLCWRCHGLKNSGLIREWVVSRFGDLRRNLRLFWVWFRQMHPERVGGWRPEHGERVSAALPEGLEWAASQAEKRIPATATPISLSAMPDEHEPALPPMDESKTDEALAAQEALKETIRQGGKLFLNLARQVLALNDSGHWRVNHETLDDFLRDPDVGWRRDRWFKMVKLGRFLKTFKELHGAEWDDPKLELPTLNERIWTRDILKGTRTHTEVEALAKRATEIPYADFEAEVEAMDQAAKRPGLKVLFNADMVVKQDGVQVGFLRRTWAMPDFQILQLKIATDKVKLRPDGSIIVEIV